MTSTSGVVVAFFRGLYPHRIRVGWTAGFKMKRILGKPHSNREWGFSFHGYGTDEGKGSAVA